jgi:colanic acid biosynthesis protein WcaH
MLSHDDFYNVCKHSNLTSIDFIISYKNKYLLGKRINNPAKGYFFVPGGTIHKQEKLEMAFRRMSLCELGISLGKDDFIFHCISQHWYKNNFIDDKFGTHYISLSFKKELTDDEFEKINIKDQHSDIKWMTEDELINDLTVHPYTKGFFDPIFFNMDSSTIALYVD